MISKLKTFALCVIAASTLNGCTTETESDNQRATYSGFVALDYTGEVILEYSDILTYVFMFNEYYSQPTVEKRDSVDRLYFANTKILREGDKWNLRKLGYSEYDGLSINTNGKMLNDVGAKWLISFSLYHYYERSTDFEIERIENGRWTIKKHDSRNREFDFSTEWDIRLSETENQVIVEGNGSLLSIATPKLKLDYTITEPLIASYNDNITSITSGVITILATDVDKNITEETVAEIITNDRVEIHFKNKTEPWHYPFTKWFY